MGKFITFEGGEGCGKSTAICLTKDWLESQGERVYITREPGGTPAAEEIRRYIMENNLDIETETLLFSIARRIHIPDIQEHLAKGEWVLCDRFLHSSLVYQGIIHDRLEEVRKANSFLDDCSMPDITFYFDCDPEIGLQRIRGNNRETNRFDEKAISFHRKVRDGYKMLLSQEECMKLIHAEKSPEDILEEIKSYLK